jgi:hypothetical protein
MHFRCKSVDLKQQNNVARCLKYLDERDQAVSAIQLVLWLRHKPSFIFNLSVPQWKIVVFIWNSIASNL